jgi:hypothetical protein
MLGGGEAVGDASGLAVAEAVESGVEGLVGDGSPLGDGVAVPEVPGLAVC